MNGFRADAFANFGDQEYREAYWEEFLNIWIAAQIRTLREQRNLTQGALAEKSGMKQSRISALEQADYSSWSVTTLKRLAKAFGVTLAVEFRGYGKRLLDFERFERRDLQEPDFSHDSVFQGTVLTPTTGSLGLSGMVPTVVRGPANSKVIYVNFSAPREPQPVPDSSPSPKIEPPTNQLLNNIRA